MVAMAVSPTQFVASVYTDAMNIISRPEYRAASAKRLGLPRSVVDTIERRDRDPPKGKKQGPDRTSSSNEGSEPTSGGSEGSADQLPGADPLPPDDTFPLVASQPGAAPEPSSEHEQEPEDGDRNAQDEGARQSAPQPGPEPEPEVGATAAPPHVDDVGGSGFASWLSGRDMVEGDAGALPSARHRVALLTTFEAARCCVALRSHATLCARLHRLSHWGCVNDQGNPQMC